MTFERFSDSAGAYIKLDSNNPSVYKQLYRAAKAKLKLRIRATININPLLVPSAAASVISAPDHLTGEAYVPPTLHTAPCAPALCPPTMGSTSSGEEPQRPTYTYVPAPPSTIKPPPSATSKMLDGTAAVDTRKEVDDEAPVPRFFSAREQFYAELASMSLKDQKGMLPSIAQLAPPGTSFTICCNNCNVAIPNAHYHCSKCDDGDYDLCEACYDTQVRCNGDDHWLVKRYVKDGKVTSSSTETVTPKKSSNPEIKEVPGAFTPETKETLVDLMDMSRTCNSCVRGMVHCLSSVSPMLTNIVFDENNFVTCTVCEDYDLCISCHIGMKHGHHPGHAFMPASEETTLSSLAGKLLAPGRNTRHAAVCDGCDKVYRPVTSCESLLTICRIFMVSVTNA